jgi:hypothetical protein
MTDLRQAAQQALKSLRGYRREINCEQPCDAERALEVALKEHEMSEQPEALRLADALDVGEISYTGMCKAAAELRRLHALNGELLEALVSFTKSDYIKKQHPIRYAAARAAIAKAEGKS